MCACVAVNVCVTPRGNAGGSDVVQNSVARALANCTSLEPEVCPELKTAQVLVDAGALPTLVNLMAPGAKLARTWP